MKVKIEWNIERDAAKGKSKRKWKPLKIDQPRQKMYLVQGLKGQRRKELFLLVMYNKPKVGRSPEKQLSVSVKFLSVSVNLSGWGANKSSFTFC